MSRRSRVALVGICASFLFTSSFMAHADTGIKARFDLPAESLGKALRDFALQAHCNISFEPSVVAGLQAPAIKGDFIAADALAMILAGTRLTTVNIDESTIRVVRSPDSSDEPEDKDALNEIVVTGSHIRGISVASPVIEIGREEIDRSGYESLADLMLAVPQNFGGGINPGTITGASEVNSRYNDNPAGASVPNLRGLGPGSTLTLVDGHRMAAGLAGGGADISSIPIDAIERVEILTDSASSIYGSDAVAGVVNIILKQKYEGAKTSVSYGYAPEGGGAQKRASQMFGAAWDGGNAMIAYEHFQQDELDAGERDFTSSASEPNALLPETKSNSATLSVRQDVVVGVSAFADGLFVARDANRYYSEPQYFAAPIMYPATLRQFAVAAGVDFDLWRDWKGTISVDEAEAKTEQNAYLLTTPSVTPENAERLLGTSHSVEGSVNGDLFALPSGSVRLAAGLGYRREGFSDALGDSGSALNNVANGGRSIRYGYAELSVPLVAHTDRPGLNFLDVVLSGRSERYSDFGDTTVPKFGLVYGPSSSVKLRSTWGRAFRAPDLYNIDGVRELFILDLPDPSVAGGVTPALIRYGGNPSLRPETADSLSMGVDFSPEQAKNLRLSSTFFDIHYKNRISQIDNPFTALTDPLNAFFVTPSPSAAYAQSVVNEYAPSEVFNETGSPLVPGNINAIVDSRLVNVATQTARGADLSASYVIDATLGKTMLFFDGTYLDLTQKNTPESPEQTLSGLSFYPPKYRFRGGATWTQTVWAVTATVNYLAHETNTQVTPSEAVSSWTTMDASVRYAPALKGLFGGTHFSLAVINILNKDPPYVSTEVQGLNYDPSNASPLGRFVTLQVSKDW
jgi:iron complex outermembrane recepter protein